MARQVYYATPSDTGAAATNMAEQFARRVTELMIEKGWNQSALARRAAAHLPNQRMDRQLISSYLKGSHLPQQVRLEAIAKALGVKPYDLISSPDVEWIGGKPTHTQRVSEDQASSASMESASGGKIRIKIDRELDAETALQIMALIARGTKQ